MPRRRRCRPKVRPSSAVLDSFRKSDKLGDGVISESDLHELLTSIGLSHDEASMLFRAAEASKDGQISYTDFIGWLFSATPIAAPEKALSTSSDEAPQVPLVTGVAGDTQCTSSERDLGNGGDEGTGPVHGSDLVAPESTDEGLVALDPADMLAKAGDQESAKAGGCDVPAHLQSGSSWDWPLSRQEKISRVGALERNLQLMDQQLLLQELEELRDFRLRHEKSQQWLGGNQSS